VKGQITADTHLGLLQANAYVNEIDVNTVPGAFGEGVDFDNRVTVVQLQDIFKIGTANLFRATVEYRRDTVNTSPVTGGQVGYGVGSASGMWELKITPTVSLTNALRRRHIRSTMRTGIESQPRPLSTAASYGNSVTWIRCV
jgi:iron complex outermembrane receptor protein